MNIRIFDISKDYNEIINLSKNYKTSPFSFDRRLSNYNKNLFPVFADEMVKNPKSTTLVLEENNRIIGYITFGENQKISRVLNKKIASILLLSIDENYRNKGFGKYLVQKSLQIMRNFNINIVTDGTDIYNIPAINVYESNGFKMYNCWHIYRYYPNINKSNYKISENIDVCNIKFINEFYDYFTRPISLLKDKKVDTISLKNYLFDKFKNEIINGNTKCLQYQKEGNILGILSYTLDKISQKTFGIGKPIYKILDLNIKKDYRDCGYENEIIQDFIARIKDFEFVEFWVDAENDYIINILENNNFHLSYTGLNFHLHLS